MSMKALMEFREEIRDGGAPSPEPVEFSWRLDPRQRFRLFTHLLRATAAETGIGAVEWDLEARGFFSPAAMKHAWEALLGLACAKRIFEVATESAMTRDLRIEVEAFLRIGAYLGFESWVEDEITISAPKLTPEEIFVLGSVLSGSVSRRGNRRPPHRWVYRGPCGAEALMRAAGGRALIRWPPGEEARAIVTELGMVALRAAEKAVLPPSASRPREI